MSGFYNSHFKEELIATAILMGVVISGSFFVAYRATLKKEPSMQVENPSVLGTSQSGDPQLDQIVNQIMATPRATPRPTPRSTSQSAPASSSGGQLTASASGSQIPTYNNTIIEQPYGAPGEYDNADYRLTILNPRLVVSTSRVFKVDVILANKRIVNGLKNRLSATIIKEGVVIAESAPFSLSESAIVYPGEQITFVATISLISGTDVARLKYLPLIEGVSEVQHDL